ncbi:toxin-antitoxin system TumE family protein [Pseudomonas chlororaphis]
MGYSSKMIKLLNIDSALESLTEDEITGRVIDAMVCSHSFKSMDEIEKRIPFVLELSTRNSSHWKKLITLSSKRYWIKETQEGVAVFDANLDCGYIRMYRLRNSNVEQRTLIDSGWIELRNEETLYEILDTPTNRHIFDSWYKDKQQVMDLPVELVSGRLKNTGVEKAFIFAKGNGCVVCGEKASCFAATTVGRDLVAVMIQLPVCSEHLADAKSHPSAFSFLASLFNLSWDWPAVQRLEAIPDELIPVIHSLAAEELGGEVTPATKRENGWQLRVSLPSGWYWLLRINSLSDYAYMLFEPGQKKHCYRADSAPHHPEIPFFPMHEHSRPDKAKDEVSPSFLYGHPLLDIKRLKSAGHHYGAYGNKA